MPRHTQFAVDNTFLWCCILRNELLELSNWILKVRPKRRVRGSHPVGLFERLKSSVQSFCKALYKVIYLNMQFFFRYVRVTLGNWKMKISHWTHVLPNCGLFWACTVSTIRQMGHNSIFGFGMIPQRASAYSRDPAHPVWTIRNIVHYFLSTVQHGDSINHPPYRVHLVRRAQRENVTKSQPTSGLNSFQDHWCPLFFVEAVKKPFLG